MSSYVGILITISIYILSLKLNKIKYINKIPSIIFTGLIVIFLIQYFAIDYNVYNKSASILTFLLGPATIALALPLIKNIDVLKENKRAIWFGFTFSTVVAILSTIVIGKVLHTNFDIILSLVPKSVTTPIAVEISKTIGGIPELTACVVILTGVVGGLMGHRFLRLFNIKNDVSIGLAIGATSHVLGTARCLEKKQDKQAAISTMALIIVGLFTSIFAPIILHFLF